MYVTIMLAIKNNINTNPAFNPKKPKIAQIKFTIASGAYAVVVNVKDFLKSIFLFLNIAGTISITNA